MHPEEMKHSDMVIWVGSCPMDAVEPSSVGSIYGSADVDAYMYLSDEPVSCVVCKLVGLFMFYQVGKPQSYRCSVVLVKCVRWNALHGETI